MARYDTYGATDDQIIEDIDSSFKGFNDRSRPDSLEPGMFTVAHNVRFDTNGLAETRKAVNVISAPFAVDTNTRFTLPFNLYADDAATSTTESGGKLIFAGVTTTTGTDASNGIINNTLVSVTGTINNVVGYVSGSNYIATRESATSISINIPVTTTGVVSGTPTISAPKLSNSQDTRVVASTNFVDPANNDEEYILLIGTVSAKAVKLSDGSTTSIDYPAGTVIDSDDVNVSAIQAFNKILIFEEGNVPLSWDLNFSNNFVEMQSGTYTQPTIKASTEATASAAGLVTLASITNTGFGALVVGDEIVVVASDMTGVSVDSTYQVAEKTDTSVSFYAEAPTEASNKSVSIIGRVSGGAGFIHAPGPSDGIVHRNRLVVPYRNTVNAGDNSYTARNVTDELLISNPFNAEKFDTTFGTFVTAGGQNDSFVAAFSFAEDKLLMFNRKSISVVTGIDSINFQDAKVQTLTKEIGLVAKDSIVQVGNQILFLSDNGVYGVSFQDLYNLRGNEVPLSEPIDSTIGNIDKKNWEKSTAVYFDNRYYLAVPMDSIFNLFGATGTQSFNNHVLVYNFLTKAWESDDFYIDRFFAIDKLIVAGTGEKRGVYAVNSQGGVHQLEASSSDIQDSTISTVGGSTNLNHIYTRLHTRQYNLGTMDRKKWNNYELVFGSSLSGTSCTAAIFFVFENRDTQNTATTYTTSNSGVSFRGRIGNIRAYGAQAQIIATNGRIRLNQLKIAGALTFKSLNKLE